MRPNLTNVTFSGNSASGAGGGMINQSIANPTLTNVVFWGNSDDGSGPDVANIDTSSPVITNTYSAALGGTNPQTLSINPFDVGPSGELFLIQNSVCVNAGADTAADDVVTGLPAALLDWRDMTTASDGTLDTGTVDMGRHYDPVRVTITALTADATDLTWTTGSTPMDEYYCVITNDQDGAVIVVDPADLTTGTAAHGLTTGAVAWMACYGIGMPALAQDMVP